MRLTSFSQPFNDRRHWHTFVCVCVCVYLVLCVLAEMFATHEFLFQPLHLRGLHQPGLQPALCIYIILSLKKKIWISDLPCVCARFSFDLDLGTGSTHTVSETEQKPHVCVPVYFPLISCLRNEEICYYRKMKRDKMEWRQGNERMVKLNKF